MGAFVLRRQVRALRKDVTAKCYGGDVTRKLKLLNKQKAGMKKLRALGDIKVGASILAKILRL